MATGVGRVLVGIVSALGLWGLPAAFAQPVAPPPAPPPTAATQTPPPVYNGSIAGWEAYFRSETERQQAIGRQLSANDMAAWYAGAPTTVPFPPDLESVYALSPMRAYRPGDGRLVYAHRGWTGIFEPWPVVAGDIWGAPYLRRVAQPVSNSITPLGPNGYFARSVYPADPPAGSPPAGGPVPAPPMPGDPAPGVTAEPAPLAPPVDQTNPPPETVPAPTPNSTGPQEF